MASRHTTTFPLPWQIAAFTAQLVAYDLPALPAERRQAVVAFAVRRVAGLPTPMRVGVGIVALTVDGASLVLGRRRLTAFLADHPLPLLGEYVRLVRSLAYAYVWDTWPATAVDGQPATAVDGQPATAVDGPAGAVAAGAAT